MRRALVALLVLAVPFLLVGCGVEDDTQRCAREMVESHVAGDPSYDAGDVRCTRNPRPWLVERQASVVVCAVRRADGGCDWFRVELGSPVSPVTTRIRLQSKDAGCMVSV
jgi:hypothetical protein